MTKTSILTEHKNIASFLTCKLFSKIQERVLGYVTGFYWFYKSMFFITLSPGHILLQEEGKREALEHFKHVIKICPNRGHFFRINYRMRGQWYPKFQQFYCHFSTCLVYISKYKNIWAESDISRRVYRLELIVNQKWKKARFISCEKLIREIQFYN